jgi:gas vesicle protein
MGTGPEAEPRDQDIERARLTFERDKWRDEHSLRVKELEIKNREQGQARWTNPLVIAVFAAAVGAIGNAAVTLITGHEQRKIDAMRTEQVERFLREAKTNNELIKDQRRDDTTKLDITNRSLNAIIKNSDESSRIVDTIKSTSKQADQMLEEIGNKSKQADQTLEEIKQSFNRPRRIWRRSKPRVKSI